MSDVPIIHIREDGKIVEKKAPVVEHQCWYCGYAFMYEIRKPSVFVEEIIWYQCPSCGAREDMYGLNFQVGKGKRKT